MDKRLIDEALLRRWPSLARLREIIKAAYDAPSNPHEYRPMERMQQQPDFPPMAAGELRRFNR